MKKIVYLFLILILSFSLFSACSDNQTVEEISSGENMISNHIEQQTNTSSNSSQALSSSSTNSSKADENSKEDISSNIYFYNDIAWNKLERYTSDILNKQGNLINVHDTYIYQNGHFINNNHDAPNLKDTNYDNSNNYAIFIGSVYKQNSDNTYSASFETLSLNYNDTNVFTSLQEGIINESLAIEYLNSIDNSFEESIDNAVFLKDYLTEDSTGYDKNNFLDIMAITNANWNIIPTKVRYINYDIDHKKPSEIWINEIESMMESDIGINNTPIIIRESWEFEAQGNKIVIVNACNLFENSEYESSNDKYSLSQDIPTDENHYIYSLTLLFLNDKLVQSLNVAEDTNENHYIYINNSPNSASQLNVSFSPYSNLNSYYTVLQKDSSGQIIRCNIYI